MRKLIIFDCDGVLVDSEVIGCRIDAQFVTKMGYPITTEDFIRRYSGINDKTMAIRLKEDANILIPDEYLKKRVPLILEAFETSLLPLIDPVLSRLDGLSIRRCIASGSSRERVIRSLEITNQMKYFDVSSIFTAHQVEKGKPAPDLFLFSAKQMEISLNDCLIIEDSVAGIQAAQAAHIPVIGFLGGSHAGFEWYQESIKAFDIPIAHNPHELNVLIQEHIRM